MRSLGFAIVILAILIGGVPLYTDCQAAGQAIALPSGAMIPMKCHWAARAALGLSVPLLAVGLLMVVRRRPGDSGALALIGVTLGVIVALLPAVLIGVCHSREMQCKLIMKPSLMLAGILVAIVSAGYWLLSRPSRPHIQNAERTTASAEKAF